MASANVVTLAALRLDARQMTDTENDPHISDAELNRWINRGYGDLYDQLISMWGEDFFAAVQSPVITTDGVSDLYPLPVDHYKNLLCEMRNTMALTPNASAPAWITMHPFPLRDKNRYNLINFATYFGYLNIRYRITGNNVQFAPVPQGGQVFRLWYAPRLVPLADTGTLALSGVTPGFLVTINGVNFTAVASGATGTQFNVGATDAESAANLAAAIVANLPPPVVYAAAGPIQSPVQLSTGGVLPASPNLAATTVLVVISNGQVTWSVNSGTTFTWGDQLDGVSGWEELVTCDAAEKVLAKQERESTTVAKLKAEMRVRLDRSAPNRNLGDPATVIETGGDFGVPGVPGNFGGGPFGGFV